jgi:hypothetical protein
MDNDDRVLSWGLLTITFFLVLLGCVLYIMAAIGWAQLCWVLASGTAGLGVLFIVSGRK